MADRCPLLFYILLHVFRPDLGAVDVALRVGGNSLGGAGNGGSGRRVRDKGGHGSGLRAPAADAALPARIVAVAFLVGGFGIGDVEDVVLVDEDAARPAELLPLLEKLSVLIE